MYTASIVLTVPPHEGATKDVLELVPYIDENIVKVELLDTVLTIRLKKNCMDLKPIADSANNLVSSLNRSVSKDFTETLFVSQYRARFAENPWTYLTERRMIKQIEPGNCYMSGKLLELAECADLSFREYAVSLGAVLESYTSQLPIESVARNGYLSSFPQHALFVAAAHQSFSALAGIADTPRGSTAILPGLTGSSTHMLSPTVCYHCFEGLKQTLVESPAMFSARCLCHRNEARSADTLLRLTTFNMREIIFFGDAQEVESMRKRILSRCQEMLDALQLEYKVVTASDPFFATGAARRIFQKLTRSKIEIQLYIPYCDVWVAIASFNDHAATLTSKYGIAPDGLRSGCFGVGLERLAYALIAQMGCDVDRIVDATSGAWRQGTRA